MKQWRNLILPLAVIGAALTGLNGCSNDPKENGENTQQAKGPVQYGGVFRMNEVEDFRTLYPLNITEVTGHHIATQVYEGLVKYNQKDLSLMPGLATRWEVLDSAKRFVFYIRKGVFFHDDPCFDGGKGREMKVEDVKWCFEKLCSVSTDNQQFANTFQDRVVGANEYYASTVKNAPLAGGVSGIKVVNDSTLEINLSKPMPGFLNILSTQGCWIYPKDALNKYKSEMRTHCVGTGPFRVKLVKEGESVILERNPNYWMFDQHGNRLPYLDMIQVSFIKDKRSEIIAFRNGELDMVFRLPVEMSKEILGELEDANAKKIGFNMQSTPAMSLTYYGFQNKTAPFDNVKVRLAFCYAIDRKLIAEKTLQGDATAGIYGIVPPSMPGYNFEGVKGFTFNPDTAKKLLAEAGYPEGRGFPKVTLQINSGGGDRNILAAEAVRNQLKANLGVDVAMETIPFATHLESIETGKALFWRTGWVADYPDAETFLTTLYSAHVPSGINERSYLNSVRYTSAGFDQLFLAALRESDMAKRNELFRQADQFAMSEAPILPVYYETNDRLVQKIIQGFDMNAMEYRDFTMVWIKTEDAAAKK